MKNTLRLTCFLLLVAPLIMAQSSSVPNGSFENWSSTTYNNLWLNGYPFSSNIQTLAIGDTTVMPTNDAYHGSYALKIRTIDTSNNTYDGHTINALDASSRNPSTWTGGTPFDEKPTGIRAYYKYYNPNYSSATTDSATIIISFKKGGSTIHTYTYLIGGWQKNSYALFQATFNPALSQTPDSVLVGFSSSDAFHNQYLVNGSVLKIDSVSFTGVSSQPEINGDFENWTQYTTPPIPNNWTVDDSRNITQTTDKYDGNYAVAIKSGYDDQKNTAYGSQISIHLFTDKGFPCPTTDSLIFQYKYLPSVSGEYANATINLYRGGNQKGSYALLLPQQNSYTRQALYFTETDGLQPDSIQIYFNSADYQHDYSAQTYAGSILYIDAVNFKSQLTTGINNTLTNNKIFFYPNPVTSISYLNLADDIDISDCTLVISNSIGKLITSTPVSNHTMSIKKADFVTGVYFYEIRKGNQVIKQGKFTVN